MRLEIGNKVAVLDDVLKGKVIAINKNTIVVETTDGMVFNFDEKELAQKKEFLTKISKILSYKQILKLQLSEREFARELMRKYRKKRK